jgi:hypothetical protein
LDKTAAQRLADKRLDEAITRVIEAYDLLPEEWSEFDVIAAFHEIGSGIVSAVIEEMRSRWADSLAKRSGDTSTLSSGIKDS